MQNARYIGRRSGTNRWQGNLNEDSTKLVVNIGGKLVLDLQRMSIGAN